MDRSPGIVIVRVPSQAACLAEENALDPHVWEIVSQRHPPGPKALMTTETEPDMDAAAMSGAAKFRIPGREPTKRPARHEPGQFPEAVSLWPDSKTGEVAQNRGGMSTGLQPCNTRSFP